MEQPECVFVQSAHRMHSAVLAADVISRIQASVDSGLDKLQSAIVDQINGMLVQLKQKAGRTEDIRRLAGCRQHGHEPSVLRIVSEEYRCGTFYAFVSVWGKL